MYFRHNVSTVDIGWLRVFEISHVSQSRSRNSQPLKFLTWRFQLDSVFCPTRLMSAQFVLRCDVLRDPVEKTLYLIVNLVLWKLHVIGKCHSSTNICRIFFMHIRDRRSTYIVRIPNELCLTIGNFSMPKFHQLQKSGPRCASWEMCIMRKLRSW